MTAIGYLVHDTTDAAVARRIRMFQAGGAEVRLGGFRRRDAPTSVAGVAGVAAHDLGRTQDARLAARAAAVARRLVLPAAVRAVVRQADVIVARTLEMLAIAVRVAAPGQRIVYESLDIHRLLLSDGVAGRAVQAVERRLLARVDLVLTSAPAFRDRYFRARQGYDGPIRIEENRLLRLEATAPQDEPAPPRDTPPWRIGWFGMLRCRRTLDILRTLVRQHPGRIDVTIAGIPSLVEFEDFHRDVADTPGLRFVGRYTAEDLPRLYGDVDFAWAIDYFEEGLNSAWLLPNRLYESLAFGAVPIALAGVETGRWLAAHAVGVRLDDPATELGPALAAMTREHMAALRGAVAALPPALLIADTADCLALTAAVTGAA